MARALQIVIPGGTGHLGHILARHFSSRGDNVTVLTRKPNSSRFADDAHGAAEEPIPWRRLHWDGENLGDWVDALEGADVILNLAGRSVNCRYTAENQREILESRVRSTRVLGEAIQSLAGPPKVWMNASTATIYRHSLDRDMDEASGEIGGGEANAPASWRFSIDVATRWEQAFISSKTPNTRKVALRSAMVMSPESGGTFDLLLGLVRSGLGGASGSGKQFVSWIHDADFVRAIDFVIDRDEFEGCVNVASPGPLPNSEFMRDLRDTWGVQIGLPATAWMLELGAILLRTESELILKSRRVVPGRLLENGFAFQFPGWVEASRDLVARRREKTVDAKSRPRVRAGLEESHGRSN